MASASALPFMWRSVPLLALPLSSRVGSGSVR